MNRLKQLREENKLSLKNLQDELIKHFNIRISRSSLSNYEREEQTPKIEVWEILAQYFDVSIPYIMGTSDVKHDSSKEANDFFNSLSFLKMITDGDAGKTLGKINDKLENLENKEVAEKLADSFTAYITCMESILEPHENLNKLDSFSEVSNVITDIFTDILIWKRWEELSPSKEYLSISVHNNQTTTKMLLPTKEDASVNEAFDNYFKKTNLLIEILNSYFSKEIKKRY